MALFFGSGIRKKVQKQAGEEFAKLKERGILSFTGMMLALEEDTAEYYETLPDKLERVDPSAVLLSISIPIPGTPFHAKMESEGRIIDHDLSHYEGDHLVLSHENMSAAQILDAYRLINRTFYSWSAIAHRWLRFAGTYIRRGKGRWRLLRAGLLSVILLKLSIFQRHHAQHKVFPDLARMVNDRSGTAGASRSRRGARARPEPLASGRA